MKDVFSYNCYLHVQLPADMRFASAGHEYPVVWDDQELSLVPHDVDILMMEPYFDFPTGMYVCMYV